MTTIKLSEQLIATCGINCALCRAYQRDKNSCCGCNVPATNKANHCLNCSIKNCPELESSEMKFCFVCMKFPCRRLKQLDQRYSLKYGLSPIENLQTIAKEGINGFIATEQKKWKCHTCGKLLCMHLNTCLNCGAINKYYPAQYA